MVVNVDRHDGHSTIPAIPINFPICGNWADDRADEAESRSTCINTSSQNSEMLFKTIHMYIAGLLF